MGNITPLGFILVETMGGRRSCSHFSCSVFHFSFHWAFYTFLKIYKLWSGISCRCSMLNVQCSMFNVRWSVFAGDRLPLAVSPVTGNCELRTIIFSLWFRDWKAPSSSGCRTRSASPCRYTTTGVFFWHMRYGKYYAVGVPLL